MAFDVDEFFNAKLGLAADPVSFDVDAFLSEHLADSSSPPKPEASWGDRVVDFGVDVASAIPQTVEALAGVAGMVPGVHYLADPVAKTANEATDWLRDTFHSDARKYEEQEISQRLAPHAERIADAWGRDDWGEILRIVRDEAGDALDAYTDNPAALIGVIGNSLGLAKTGAVVGSRILSSLGRPVVDAAGNVSRANAALAGRVGEGIVAGGLVASTGAREGDEFSDRYYGLPAGLVTAATPYALDRLMPGVADIDTVMAGGLRGTVEAGGRAGTQILKAGGREALEELFQGANENAMENLAKDEPWMTGLGAEAVVGPLAGFTMGAGAEAVNQAFNRGQPRVSPEGETDLVGGAAGSVAQPGPRPVEAEAPTQPLGEAVDQDILNGLAAELDARIPGWGAETLERAKRLQVNSQALSEMMREMAARHDAERRAQMDAVAQAEAERAAALEAEQAAYDAGGYLGMDPVDQAISDKLETLATDPAQPASPAQKAPEQMSKDELRQALRELGIETNARQKKSDLLTLLQQQGGEREGSDRGTAGNAGGLAGAGIGERDGGGLVGGLPVGAVAPTGALGGGQQAPGTAAAEPVPGQPGGQLRDTGAAVPAGAEAAPAGGGVRGDAATVERYQWMRNKEGGQGAGNRQEILPLTEADFQQEIKPRLAQGYADTLAEYQSKHPEVTHASWVTHADGGRMLEKTGSLDSLRPVDGLRQGWAKAVESFDSTEAAAQAATADSEVKSRTSTIADLKPGAVVELDAGFGKGLPKGRYRVGGVGRNSVELVKADGSAA
ncbi:MAG: hypothetical protein H7842_13185, partial [Gammaproteobacteria bacterium SHHR-1]